MANLATDLRRVGNVAHSFEVVNRQEVWTLSYEQPEHIYNVLLAAFTHYSRQRLELSLQNYAEAVETWTNQLQTVHAVRLPGPLLLQPEDLAMSEAVTAKIVDRLAPKIERALLEKLESGDLFGASTTQNAFNFAEWCIENRALLEPYKNMHVAVDIDKRKVVLTAEDGLDFAQKLRELETKIGRTYRTLNTRAYGRALATES